MNQLFFILCKSHVLKSGAMYRKYLLVIIFSSLSLFANMVTAQENAYFDHISSSDGLLDDVVYSIFQDSQGFIWIGSMGGLQRYDGYGFVNYTYNHEDPTKGLSQSVVRHIMEDSKGVLWVGTWAGGVTRIKHGEILPPLADSINDPKNFNGSRVEDIIEDQDGGYWIASNKGLIYYNDSTFSYFQHDPKDENSLSNNAVFSLLKDSRGQLWVGTGNGLNLYLGGGKFKRYTPDPTNKVSFNDNFIHDIFEDSKGNIWLANIFHGISRYNPEDQTFTNFKNDPNDPTSISHNITLGIDEDQHGNLWIATWGGGLNKFNNGMFESFVHDINDQNSIAGDHIEEVMVDRENNVWTVNFFGGVNKMKNGRISKLAIPELRKKFNLNDASIIESITMTPDSALWVGTFNGLGVIKNDRIEYFTKATKEKEGLTDNGVYVLHTDKLGRVWIGYGDKQYVDVIENGKISHIPIPESFHDQEIWTISSDNVGNVWLGAINWGICVYSGDGFTMFHHEPDDPEGLSTNYILDLHGAEDGSMWIATGDAGLIKFKDGVFTNFRYDPKTSGSLTTNAITTVITDNENNVWVGFPGGVSRLDQATNQFQFYGEKDGLVGSVVEEFCVDNQGRLWVATHNGASLYNKESDRFTSYTGKDGFSDPNLTCIYCGDFTDRVYFGGQGLMHVFDGSYTGKNIAHKPLVLSGFQLQTMNDPELDRTILSKLSKSEPVTLSHRQNSFTLDFTVLTSDIKPDHTYSYRIRNKSKEWDFLGKQNSISFNYLVPDRYELDIKSTISDGSEIVKSIIIFISPPWWATYWFRGLMVALIVAIILVLVYWRLRILEKSKKNLTKTVKLKTAEINKKNQSLEELNVKLVAKINQLESTQQQLIESEKMASISTLTAGLAHELNNPLSYIGGMVRPLKLDLEEIGNFIPATQKDQSEDLFNEIDVLLGNVSEGVSKASKIIQNLIDISPTKSGQQDQVFDLKELLEISANLLSKGRSNVQLIVELPDDLFVFGNQIELNQALINIIKNGLEAIGSEKQGTIRIAGKLSSKKIELTFEDNGKGIPQNDLKKIFEPFYTTKPPGSGTGLGLYITYAIIKKHGGRIDVNSKDGQGTTFKIRLTSQPKPLTK